MISLVINIIIQTNYFFERGIFPLLIFNCRKTLIYKRVKQFSTSRLKISSKIFKTQFLKNAQNDLEIPAFKLYPVLGKLKIFLSNINRVKFVRMTGSGSVIVANFSNKKQARCGFSPPPCQLQLGLSASCTSGLFLSRVRPQ